MGEVYGDVRLVERLVEGVEAFAHPDGGGGLGVELERPPALPVKQERGLGLPPRAPEFVQSAELRAEPSHLMPTPRVLRANMWDHRAVEFLGPCLRLAPLEEHDALRPAGDGAVAPEAHLVWPLRDVALAPVHAYRRLFHKDPGVSVSQRTHQVAAHGGAYVGLGVRGVGVGIIRDEVLARGPLPVVHGLEEAHKVGGDGGLRRRLTQYLLLHLEEG